MFGANGLLQISAVALQVSLGGEKAKELTPQRSGVESPRRFDSQLDFPPAASAA